jgi:hypothetical protein
MSKETGVMQKLIESFIMAANAFDVEGTLSLFSADAVIDDVSVGDAFVDRNGVRHYLERFLLVTAPTASCCRSKNSTNSIRTSGSISQAISDTRSGS